MNKHGEYLPIGKFGPYPRRALSRGMTGWVIVEFTVTELGTVIDPVVVSNCGWIKSARNRVSALISRMEFLIQRKESGNKVQVQTKSNRWQPGCDSWGAEQNNF